VIDRPEIIKKLESKLAETLRDRQLVAEVSGNKADQSALAEYGKISQNANIPPGIRYLALHCIADKQGFYADPRDKSQMVATVSQAMGSLVPGDVVKAIECLKTQYSSIYQLDESCFDQYEAHAVEFMTRVPIDRQDKTVAENKDTQLNPRPISTDRLPTSPPPQPFTPTAIPTPLPTPAPNYEQVVNHRHNSPRAQVDPHQNRAETTTQNGNKGALIIAGAIILAAMIFSSALFSSRNSQTASIVTDIPKRVETPTSSSSDNTDRPPPDALIAQYYQEINSRNYQAAWNKLPNNLREDLNVHPNGYQSFVDFFNGFGGVHVNNLTVVDRTDYSAVVNADLSCQLKNGNDSPLFLRFSLNWNNSNRQWQISKIRFNPDRKSYCGVSN
jgi:hypothetical protein